MDSLLRLADQDLAGNNGIQRSLSSFLNLYREFHLRPTARLAYRPEPASSDTALEDVGFTDYSFLLFQVLVNDPHSMFDDELIERLETLRKSLSDQEVHWLTHIDVAASTPSRGWSISVKFSVKVLQDFLEVFASRKHTLWIQYPTDLQQRLRNCETYIVAHRLVFYDGRLKGRSIEELRVARQEMRQDLGIPEDWRIFDELFEIKTEINSETDRLSLVFEEDVKTEWVEPHIPVSEFTDSINNTMDVDCSICRDNVTPPGVQTACGHVFCSECLASWAYACHANSHTCPCCRSQLFEQPTYRPEQSDTADDYQGQVSIMDALRLTLLVVHSSAAWLQEEIDLQKAYANCTSSSESDDE